MEKEKKKISAQEYLALEREAEFKSEFYNGETFSLAGASLSHNRIVRNISSFLHQLLKQKGCEIFLNDMRLKVSEEGLYTYPDLMIVCGEFQFIDEAKDTLLNPAVIIEVLSKSTESYDRGKKFEFYRKIASLKEYVLVSQEKPMVEIFTKDSSGGWLLRDENNVNKSVTLSSIECSVPLSEIYFAVDFQE